MKTVKKLLSIVFGLALLLNIVSVPALAVDPPTYTITIESKTSGHHFQAYQVFKGEYSTDGTTKVLSNVQWGNGVVYDTPSGLLAALQADGDVGSLFTGITTASEVAGVIAANGSSSTFMDAVSKIISEHLSGSKVDSTTSSTSAPFQYTMTGLTTGYYFVNETTPDAGTAYTKYILRVVGASITVQAKTDSPSIMKKVQENNRPSYQDTWNDAADYNIGDDVPFRVVGLVPDMTYYTEYKYTMYDKLSDGLTLNAGSIKLYYVSGSSANMLNVATVASTSGTPLDPTVPTSGITIDTNPSAATNSTFSIYFSDLKTTPNVTGPGFIVAEYTAKLNSNAVIANSNTSLDKKGNPNEVYLKFSNNPNGDGEGETPKDEVVVFTYSIPAHKVKEDLTTLKGAKFAVFKSETAAAAAASDPSEANLASALTFTGSSGSYVLGGTVVILEGDISAKYAIQGLDQGTYYLVETEAPSGFNRIKTATVVTLTPSFDTSAYVDHHIPGDNDQLTDVKVNDAKIINIINKAGTTLPETGGIGTTIFTLGGIILMLGALIVFVAKRKLASQKTER